MILSRPEILLETQFEHPEGVVWDSERQRLLWVDVFRGELWVYDIRPGALRVIDLAQTVGSVAPRKHGGFICAVAKGFGLVTEAGECTLVGDLRLAPSLQMNDGAVDLRGRFWAGSMSALPRAIRGAAGLYRLDPDGTISLQLDGVAISNGIGWSPDARRCYYVDSPTRRIDVFDFDLERGTIANRQPLAEFETYPDGLAVDIDGCAWVALFEGSEVRRITPKGKTDRIVRLPGTQVTTCAFGGHDFRTLFIAVSALGLDGHALGTQAAGHIFAVDVGVQGLSGTTFAG